VQAFLYISHMYYTIVIIKYRRTIQAWHELCNAPGGNSAKKGNDMSTDSTPNLSYMSSEKLTNLQGNYIKLSNVTDIRSDIREPRLMLTVRNMWVNLKFETQKEADGFAASLAHDVNDAIEKYSTTSEKVQAK